MKIRVLLSFGAALALAGCLAPVTHDENPPAAGFERALIAKGARLAAMGNCASCHTAEGGKPYAGGRELRTPFGTVHGTNITPDAQTGMGRWSEAEFTRAMHEGVDREGRHLYPAFPYDHFTRVTDEDVRALYAFIMTREPVRSETPPNRMLVPRPFVAIWKKLYFEPGRFRANPTRSAEWNRGAYLVDGLAHCGACHTPRNNLGAERKDRAFAGGEVGAWHAPALNAESPSPMPWTADALRSYLRTGLVEAHAITAGPMTPVVRNLAQVSEEDVRAIAVFTISLDTRTEEQRARHAKAASAGPREGPAPQGAVARGAQVYVGACADCHDRGREAEGGALPLPLATGLALPTPRNLAIITLDGILPEEDARQPWMPDYRGALTEDQLADLVVYLRSLTPEPPWNDVREELRKASRGHE